MLSKIMVALIISCSVIPHGYASDNVDIIERPNLNYENKPLKRSFVEVSGLKWLTQKFAQIGALILFSESLPVGNAKKVQKNNYRNPYANDEGDLSYSNISALDYLYSSYKLDPHNDDFNHLSDVARLTIKERDRLIEKRSDFDEQYPYLSERYPLFLSNQSAKFSSFVEERTEEFLERKAKIKKARIKSKSSSKTKGGECENALKGYTFGMEDDGNNCYNYIIDPIKFTSISNEKRQRCKEICESGVCLGKVNYGEEVYKDCKQLIITSLTANIDVKDLLKNVGKNLKDKKRARSREKIFVDDKYQKTLEKLGKTIDLTTGDPSKKIEDACVEKKAAKNKYKADKTLLNSQIDDLLELYTVINIPNGSGTNSRTYNFSEQNYPFDFYFYERIANTKCGYFAGQSKLADVHIMYLFECVDQTKNSCNLITEKPFISGWSLRKDASTNRLPNSPLKLKEFFENYISVGSIVRELNKQHFDNNALTEERREEINVLLQLLKNDLGITLVSKGNTITYDLLHNPEETQTVARELGSYLHSEEAALLYIIKSLHKNVSLKDKHFLFYGKEPNCTKCPKVITLFVGNNGVKITYMNSPVTYK